MARVTIKINAFLIKVAKVIKNYELCECLFPFIGRFRGKPTFDVQK